MELEGSVTWRTRAACRDHDPDLWFPSESDDHTRQAAQAICAACPVRYECTTYATTHHINDGIWGGRDLGIKPKPPRPYRPCGTVAAYRRHVRSGETPCDACKAANTAYAKTSASYRAKLAGTARAQKLTEDQVRAIRAAHNLGQAIPVLALRYQVSVTQVTRIVRRLAWANV